MAYLGFIGNVLFTITVLLPLTAHAAAQGLPLSYSINSPLVISDAEWRVDIYQASELSIGRHQQADKQEMYTRAQAGEAKWNAASTFIAGDPTGNRLAKYQNIGRDIWQIRELRDLQQGHFYTNENFEEVQWSVDDLAFDLRRGSEDEKINGVETRHYVLTTSYNSTKVDRDDDERKHKTIMAQRDFWFATQYTFSPLQLLPLHLSNNTFVNHAPDRVQEAIYQRLEKQLRQQGMLMRTRLELGGKKYTIEVSDLKTVENLDLAGVLAMPIIPENKVAAVAGPLFFSEMLSDSIPETGRMEILFDSGAEQTKVAGKSGFSVMETGDLAIAATFSTPDGKDGLLVLLRPVLGMVKTGKYTTAERRSSNALKEMSHEQLREHARSFQAFALVDGENTVKVYTEAVAGTVTIESVNGERMSGAFDLNMNAETIIGGREHQSERVTGEFTAVKGLDARLRSPTSRYLP